MIILFQQRELYLDQIQYENDVIFVVAGTNKPNTDVVENRFTS